MRAVPKDNCLKYTLSKREARYWFILSMDSDHWVHTERRRNMTERLAECARQNGFAGVQVFHPNGIHLETVWSEGRNVTCFCTESGGAALEEKIGNVSAAGRATQEFLQSHRQHKKLNWCRPTNMVPNPEIARKWENES